MTTDIPLTAYERWMVAQNVKRAQFDGFEKVVAQLRAGGYHRVAKEVERAQGVGARPISAR